jgi:hypothetical protein
MVMLSYIKIIGPPILKAIKVLEKMAIEFPLVCIMDTIISHSIPSSVRLEYGSPVKTFDSASYTGDLANFTHKYFNSNGVVLQQERCETIISKSGVTLGDFDFYFEWYKKPTNDEVHTLLDQIDEVLSPLGCYYTIVHKNI